MAEYKVIGRMIGVDYGGRRIGLAISDPERRIASPAAALDAEGSAAANAQRVAKWAREREGVAFVVGLPLNMDGSIGPQAKVCEAFAAELRKSAALPVYTWDERLSSFQADEFLDAAATPRGRRKMRRDALAAMVILQSYLDSSPR